MDEKQALEIAVFRYGVIAPLVSRKLDRGQQARLLREAASRHYEIPYSDKTTISIRTLERWLTAYREQGLDGLKPNPRADVYTLRKLPADLFQKALHLKREVPQRSVHQIISILEMAGEAPPGLLKRSTLARHLRRELPREAAHKPPTFRRFQAPHRNAIWQGDCQHTLYLPDPNDPTKKRQAYLIAFLDDYSRLITHAEFYFEENRPKLEDCLKKAILRYGVPEKLYVDNASIHSPLHLGRICAELGIRLIHSRPYCPQGRGKIERFFLFVDRSFKPEAYALISQGKLTTLPQLNELFWAWLEVAYHQKKHSSTGQLPHTRFAHDNHPIRRVDPDFLREAFLWQEERQVDKTSCFPLLGNVYEVDPSLARKKVTIRYDPYDLGRIKVFFAGQQYPDALPVSLERTRHPRVEEPPEPVPPTGLNYLELLARKHDQQKKAQVGKLNFDLLSGREGDGQ